jgi:membrane protease YdiL (CAAX protease family)
MGPINSREQSDAMRISIVFLVLTFALSTPFWYLIARLPSGSDPMLLSIANMWCPALAAILARLIHRRSLRGFGFTVGRPRWLVVALLLPALAGLVMYGSAWLLGVAPVNETNVSRLTLSFIPLFFGVLGASCLAALGEELGWRGLLVPELSRRMGYTKVALVSGVIWLLWHLPLMFFSSYHGTGPLWLSLVYFTVLILASSFVHAWMRLVSGSVWVSALLHGSSNYFIQAFYPTLTIRTPAGDAMLGEFGWFTPIVSAAIAVAFWINRGRVPSLAEVREEAIHSPQLDTHGCPSPR